MARLVVKTLEPVGRGLELKLVPTGWGAARIAIFKLTIRLSPPSTAMSFWGTTSSWSGTVVRPTARL